jgi:hypothetical protein
MVDGKGLGCGYLLADTGRVFWNRDEAQLLNWWVQEAERAKNLTTVEGQRVMVLTAGTINDGPGPDILDCHLLLDDLEYSGAVEMHLDASSWFTHGHAGDPAYEQVVLHVVTTGEGGPDLPTLVVPTARLSRQTCPAGRPVRTEELLGVAYQRFQLKQQHLQQLSRTAYSPLLLGMFSEVLLQRIVQQVGSRMGAPNCSTAFGINARRNVGAGLQMAGN